MSLVAFDKIVPFWQDFILDDRSVILALKERVAWLLCLIGASVNRREYGQPGLSPCSCSQLAGLSSAFLKYSISLSVTISAGIFMTCITAWNLVVRLRIFDRFINLIC